MTTVIGERKHWRYDDSLSQSGGSLPQEKNLSNWEVAWESGIGGELEGGR